MRAVLRLALGLLILTADTAAQQTPARDPAPSRAAGAGLVRGRVVGDETGVPVARARVALRPGTARPAEPVFTDADGRFEMGGLPSGRYVLTITKAGYVLGKLGANEVDRSVAFELGDRSTVDIDARLLKAAAISGRILDDLGEPILAANVQAGIPQRVDGQLRMQVVRSAITDDRGEFRIGGLPAGTYLVSVGAETAGMIIPGTPDEWRRNIGWRQTYYPAATAPIDAQRIPLKVGDERSNVDIMVRPSTGTGGRLTFTVTDQAGVPASGSIRFAGDSIGQVLRIRQGQAQASMPSGEWTILAQGDAGVAGTALSVGSDDLALQLVLTRAGRMSGRISTDDGSPFDPARFPFEVRLNFNDRVRTVLPLEATRVSADGAFEIVRLLGKVEFAAIRPFPGWSFQSITHDGRNLLDSPMEFAGGEELTDVRIVISRSEALSGVVQDKERKPAAGCFATLFPEDPTALASGRLTRRVRADLDGRFRFSDLVTGPYFVAASRGLDPIDWALPENLASLRERAVRVVLGRGPRSDVTLECLQP